ncbi:MAG: histidine kinase [Eubacteriales bacterium]|nr:histidine kinase [Eubacteriales bacterium]
MFRKLSARFSKLPYRTKLAITLSGICAAFILFIGITSYNLASGEIRNLSAKLSDNNVTSAERTLGEYLDKVHDYSTQALRIGSLSKIGNEDVYRRSYSQSRSDQLKVAADISKLVNSAAADNVTIQAVEIYLQNGFAYSYPSVYSSGCDSYLSCTKLLDERNLDIKNDYIRTQWVTAPMTERRTGGHKNFLLCIRFLYDSVTMEKKGILVLALDEDELYDSYAGFADESMILGFDGLIYSGRDSSAIGQLYDNEKLQKQVRNLSGASGTFSFQKTPGKTVMVSCHKVLDNQAILVIPFHYYTGISQEEMRGYLLSVGTLLVVGIAIATLLALVLSGSLTRSVRGLASVVKEVDGGNRAIRYQSTSSDEIAYLGAKINSMLDSLETAARNRENDLMAAQLLELKLMQSQINPHLLYNTLDSVLWFLQTHQSDDATTLLTALSGFFKLSLSRGKAEIPLAEEIALVQYYLSIQHLARQQNIVLKVDVTPELLQQPVIKLSLQPIVENAVLHGFAGYRNDGVIQIRAERADSVLIVTITDNGIGLMPEELETVASTLEQYPPPENMRFFGLYNVNWRIRRTYGKEYGLSIDSVVCDYTRITLRFPFPMESAQDAANEPPVQ